MKSDSVEFITLLQKKTTHIRNICILAHVDHGKTTIADGLIASNGIISKRLAGTLRYMDNREDEQKRGITMKSSSISLMHVYDDNPYLINLIDTPGHIDFSIEVNTALRVCDGALVVVDVVEGVCPQTNSVLRQAWLEGIKPCLVLNKIDRLITELKLTPLEAYYHLQNVLGQVNAVTGILFSQDILEKTSMQQEEKKDDDKKEDDIEQTYDWSSGLDEADDEKLYFSPLEGNVVFSSAVDGWSFNIDTFSTIYSAKLGVSKKALSKTLWGDYYLNMKAKKLCRGAKSKGKKPLFVQCILEQIWSIYDAVTLNRDKAKIDKITDSLGLKISVRDSRHCDNHVHLHAIMSQWIPLSDSVLNMVCSSLPNPTELTDERVNKLMCGGVKSLEYFNDATRSIKNDLLHCSTTQEAPVIVLVSKMITIKNENVTVQPAEGVVPNQQTDNTSNDENKPNIEVEHEDIFIAFARVFSGTLKRGSKVYVLGPKYDPNEYHSMTKADFQELVNKESSKNDVKSLSNVVNDGNISMAVVENLYLMMAKEMINVDAIPAGNIVGIGGLGRHILKCATLSSSSSAPSLTTMTTDTKPIIRVAVEPVYPSQMSSLVFGMKLLNQADPCVEVYLQETGEYVIAAAGEVHLQRCLKDLRELYAKIEIKASDPITSFRETIVPRPKTDMVGEEIGDENVQITQYLPSFMLKEIESYNTGLVTDIEDEITVKYGESKCIKLSEKLGLIDICTVDKQYKISIHAKPIPKEIVILLEENFDLLRIIHSTSVDISNEERHNIISSLPSEVKTKMNELFTSLQNEFKNHGKLWQNILSKIWSIGPRGMFSNILVNDIKEYNRQSIWQGIVDELKEKSFEPYREFDNAIISGFQVAVQSGPICEEPMSGVAFFIEQWEKVETEVKSSTYGPLSGQLISAVRQGCRQSFMCQPMRLVSPYYSCEIFASSDVLGKLYAVISKHDGKVLSEDMKEGSDVFIVKAQIPVAESFGFAENMRKKTSGLANPQLVFSHWQTLDVDPFWVPATEEEYELYGEKADSGNQVLNYVNTVRKRKGLYIEKKTVEFAEKQRTLKKNK